MTQQPERCYVDGLREEVEQMSGLVRELLEFSKAGLSGNETVLRTVDAAAIGAVRCRNRPEGGLEVVIRLAANHRTPASMQHPEAPPEPASPARS